MEKETTFLRELYLHATPAVDLNDVSVENPINPFDYTIKRTVVESIIKDFSPTFEDELFNRIALVGNGPDVIEDE
jgi:hypothetical protein